MENHEKVKWFLAGAGDLIGGIAVEADTFEQACENTRQQMNWADGLFATSDDQQMYAWFVTTDGLKAANEANSTAHWFTCQSASSDPDIPLEAKNRLSQFARTIPANSRLANYRARFPACPVHQVNHGTRQLIILCRDKIAKEMACKTDEKYLVAECSDKK